MTFDKEKMTGAILLVILIVGIILEILLLLGLVLLIFTGFEVFVKTFLSILLLFIAFIIKDLTIYLLKRFGKNSINI